MVTTLKRIRWFFTRVSPHGFIVSALLLLMACGLSDDTHSASASNSESLPPARDATDLPTVPPRDTSARAPLTLAAIETLVRAHAATFFGVAPDQLRLVEAVARTWPDRGLGCSARRGMYEPEPTPGYLIVLAHNATTLRYHADQYGRFVPCNEASRPRNAIR